MNKKPVQKNTLIVLVGPTAVGKTDLSIQLAQKLETDIISCDSRQFFREMSIGTAKPTPEEVSKVKHHFIDSHSIFEPYSVGDFEKEALHLLEKLFVKKKVVLMVGGSGLYIKAICEGLDNFPKISPTTRQQIIERYNQLGISYLQEELERLDATYFEKVDRQNPQRMIRALEVCVETGQPFSTFRQQKKVKRPFEILKIGLEMERPILYERINQRVDQMLVAGLLKEVESLYAHRHLNALRTVGYQEFMSYFEQEMSLEEATELVKRNTRRYAKRQLTWFRKDKTITWFEATDYEKVILYVKNYLKK